MIMRTRHARRTLFALSTRHGSSQLRVFARVRVRAYFLKLSLKLEATLGLKCRRCSMYYHRIHQNLLGKVKMANYILLINSAKSILC